MGDIKIGKMVLGMVETNCYFLYDEDTKEAVVVDPPKSGIAEKLGENGLKVAGVILTHGHFDHIMGVHRLQEECGAKVYAYKGEDALLKDAVLNASDQIRRPYTVEADVLLEDGEEFSLAGIDFKVLSTPGHTAGSCCYYVASKKWLLSGDTLFEGSIGRSDLPTGSDTEIIESVHKLIDSMEDDVTVYPGHGNSTTIGRERSCNPFYS